MRPQEILLHTPQDGRCVYQFACPSCHAPVEKPADRRVVALLISAGVDVASEESLLRGPASDGTHPGSYLRRATAGPAFTLDDVIDFHFLLQDDVYVEEVLDSGILLADDTP